MKIVGIIIEANPFHEGHQYLINKVKEDLNPDLLIACMSGYFNMRGEISVISKLNKCDILLNSGFDLVVELPITHALNSADIFASTSVDILNRIGITHLAFGIEEGSLNQLNQIIELEQNNSFKEVLLTNLKNTNRYKKAYYETITYFSKDLSLSNLTLLPNNTLALSYLRSLKNTNIIPHCVTRIGSNDLDSTINQYPSGTALRTALKNNIDVSNYIPFDVQLLSNLSDVDSKLKTLLLNLMINRNYADTLHISEGIDNYIFNNFNFNLTLEDNLNNLCNKKYSKSKLRRVILSLLLNIPSELVNEVTNIRVLGFNNNGKDYLKQIKHLSIITNIKKINNKIINEEIKASKLYSILVDKDHTIDEYKFPRKVK